MLSSVQVLRARSALRCCLGFQQPADVSSDSFRTRLCALRPSPRSFGGFGFKNTSAPSTPAVEQVTEHADTFVARFLSRYTNHELQGVPKNAGTASVEGFSLKPMVVLLKHLGNPHLSAPVVHIAGTKGKGSTSAFIASVLRAANLRVGVYTSPHIVNIRERISVSSDGAIPGFDMVALIERSQTGIALAEAELGCKPSHFEVLTALAFAHFSHVKVDAMVVEAGIGGLTDATNVISTSNLALSVITTIDAEHLDALGGSIQSIAQAKAGIMKRGCANVVGQQIEEEVFGILSRHADAVGATLLNAAEEVSVLPVNVQAEVEEGAGVCQECDIVRWELPTITAEDDEEIEVADLEHWSTGAPLQRTNALHVRTASHVARGRRPTWRLQGVRLRMVGSHQRVNVAAAVRALLWLREEKKWEITDEHIRLGLQAATLPVRFQVLKASEATPGGAGLLVLDGAHTPVAARMLALTLDEVFPKHKVALVVAMARDKEHIGILQGLGTIEACEAIIFTEVKIAGSEIRAAPSAELERLAVQTLNRHNGQENLRKEVMKIKTAANMEEALRLARAQVGTVGVVCVTGSLHAAAAALSLWQVEQA